jgi:hypothetical protein
VRWRRRRQGRPVDDGHRLRGNDVVPVAAYRTYQPPHGRQPPTDGIRPGEILDEPTRELPVVDTADPLPMTPGQEHRSGRRRWLP